MRGTGQKRACIRARKVEVNRVPRLAHNIGADAVTESSIPLQFRLLVFPNVQQLELTGPYEVFATWPGGRVRLVAKTLESVTSSTGLVLEPDASFDDCPQLDVLCVPRGCRGQRFDGR
jgi:putative intracellular protease/amidase